MTDLFDNTHFTVTYRLTGDSAEARAKAQEICFEQTVEFPPDLTSPEIQTNVVGQLVALGETAPQRHEAIIAYPCATAGTELTQFLNVLFGNTSIKPGIRVERFDLPPTLLAHYQGPRYGRADWRERLAAPHRPLLCTALKPLGYSAQELAALAYQFALGGIDIIKDDHGLADQAYAPFADRVSACAHAVQEANAKTGYACVYMPNITAPSQQLIERAQFAQTHGAGALLIAPGLTGFEAMRSIAADKTVNLPVMSHPALLGSFTASPDNGFSHFALYGQLMRLAGADATIFPSWGGRFSFSREECVSIVQGTQLPMGHLRAGFPAPGGGMTLQRVPEMQEVYGREVIFLMGGGLHRHSPDLTANSRYFRDLVEAM
jgi:ribulose-bisphosphate carboxylase large chain